MATLVSPGTSVTVTDESFYVPVTSPTVPLFFIATNGGKKLVDGVTIAEGTIESNVVRTITSLNDSISTYGIPSFRKDGSGNEFHGDCRNEYGLFALNQFLGMGSYAYVVRANVDLADASSTFISAGTPIAATATRIAVGDGTISSVTATSTFVKPETITVTLTSATTFEVSGTLSGIIGFGTVGLAFTSPVVNFTIQAGTTPFSANDYFTFDLTYTPASFSGTGTGKVSNIVPSSSAIQETVTIAFTSSSAFTVTGSVSGSLGSGTVGTHFSHSKISFDITAGSTAFANLDAFTIALTSVTVSNPLGADQTAKRQKIVNALASVINSNQEVRSPVYEYNLIVCPGYHEVVDEMVALNTEIEEEAFVIADTPCNLSPELTTAWSATSARVHSAGCGYYYPWGLASNLDGRNVFVAASGSALRTFAYSDNASYVWFAPAGTRRGVVTGVTSVGYVTGTLGQATKFKEVSLNKGQQDILYSMNINPILLDPLYGLYINGQKTSSPNASALDRVNVWRLVAYIRRGLRKLSVPFRFQPNDKITRSDLKSASDSYLSDIMSNRGLEDFATVCDESNNTAVRRDRNELWETVALKPTHSSEFVYIPIRLLSAGAAL